MNKILEIINFMHFCAQYQNPFAILVGGCGYWLRWGKMETEFFLDLEMSELFCTFFVQKKREVRIFVKKIFVFFRP